MLVTRFIEQKIQCSFQQKDTSPFYRDRRGNSMDQKLLEQGLSMEEIRIAKEIGLSFRQAKEIGNKNEVQLDNGTILNRESLIDSDKKSLPLREASDAVSAAYDNLIGEIEKTQEKFIQKLKDEARNITGGTSRVNKALAINNLASIASDMDLGTYAQKILDIQKDIERVQQFKARDIAISSSGSISNQAGESQAAATMVNAEMIKVIGENLTEDRSFADKNETDAIDYMFEKGLVKQEEVPELGTTRLVFDVEALKAMDPEEIKPLQELLQKDGTYPKGDDWIDGDVLKGTRTIEAAQSTFGTNISAYMDQIRASNGEINIGVIQEMQIDSSGIKQ